MLNEKIVICPCKGRLTPILLVVLDIGQACVVEVPWLTVGPRAHTHIPVRASLASARQASAVKPTCQALATYKD
eukprot:827968-Amphidinium_carterae.2